MSETKVKIGTHSGFFQCDETLACSLLKILPRFKDAEIVRSRDLAVLADCTVVVDVGAEFDPARMRFDHHQASFSHSFNSLDSTKPWTTKLSGSGLIYFHFGREIISHVLGRGLDNVTEKVFDKVYENFVQEIDAIDNGIATHDGVGRYSFTTDLSSRVSRLRPNWNDEDRDTDPGFYRAMELTRLEFLERVHYYARVWLPAREVVKSSLLERFSVHSSGLVLEFSKGGVPVEEHLFELEEENNLTGEKRILYAICPESNTGHWIVVCVKVRAGSFDSRLGFPAHWRGLRDQDLERVSGFSGATFVHPTGFIGGHKTRAGVLEMIEASLKQL